MNISTLAIANLKRRKAKATFLAVGIAVGIGTVVALLSLSASIKKEIGSQLDQFGANIVVVPKSDNLSLDYGGVTVSSVAFDSQQLNSTALTKIGEIPYRNRLSAVAPKLLGRIDVEGRAMLLAGVDFPSELRLKRWWQIVGTSPKGGGDLLLGYDAAIALSVIKPTNEHSVHAAAPNHTGHETVSSGSSFELARSELSLGDRVFRIAGVLRPTAGSEDRMVFVGLAEAQSLLQQPGRLSLIEISALCKDCPVEDIVQQLNLVLPDAKASAVQQTVRAREQTVEQLTRFSMAISVVVLLIGALLVFTTMTGSVVERTREIGVLRAVGFRRTHVMAGLIVEIAMISLGGGLLGWTSGTLLSWAALPYFAETETHFDLRLQLLPQAAGAALLIGVLSSLVPIFKAARLDPSEAVRSV